MEESSPMRSLLGLVLRNSAPFGAGLLAEPVVNAGGIAGLLGTQSFAQRMAAQPPPMRINSIDDARAQLRQDAQLQPNDPRVDLAMALSTTTPGVSSLLFDRGTRAQLQQFMRDQGSVSYGGGLSSDYWVMPSGHVVRIADHASPNARSAADLYVANSPGIATVQNTMVAPRAENIIGQLSRPDPEELWRLLQVGAERIPSRFADVGRALSGRNFPSAFGNDVALGFNGSSFRSMPTPQIASLFNRQVPYGMDTAVQNGMLAELLARQPQMNWTRP